MYYLRIQAQRLERGPIRQNMDRKKAQGPPAPPLRRRYGDICQEQRNQVLGSLGSRPPHTTRPTEVVSLSDSDDEVTLPGSRQPANTWLTAESTTRITGGVVAVSDEDDITVPPSGPSCRGETVRRQYREPEGRRTGQDAYRDPVGRQYRRESRDGEEGTLWRA